MIVTEFLSKLRSREIRVWVEDERLCYDAPSGALTPDLRAALVAQKAEIIALLRQSAPDASIEPIRPAARTQPLPLSFAQQRLWFIDQMTPGVPSYNIPLAMRLNGRLDLVALQRSIDAMIRRHETLRTTFGLADGQPCQIIAPPAHLPLVALDLRALPAPLRSAAARRAARVEAQRPFDLARGPLVRVSLIRLAHTEHLGLVTVHHIIADGWSMGVIIREIAALYAAYARHAPARLPDLPIQYADFALWQQKWLQGEADDVRSPLQTQLAYWRQHLSGQLPLLELPIAHPRPPIQTFAGATRVFTLGSQLSAGLLALGQRADTTLFMTLLAGFNTLLYRYTGQTDILIGTPIANRTRPEIEPLIGLFVNTLVLRADLSGNPTTRALLARVREIMLAAYAHQDLPFERLVEELRPERDLSHTPLFQVMLVLQTAPTKRLELPGLTLQRQEIDTGTARFDLLVSLIEGPDGVHGFCEYNTDLFDDAAIARLLGHYRILLAGMAAEPERRIGELPLLTRAERAQLLGEWNDTAAGLGGQASGVSTIPDGCIHNLFEAQAARTPDAVAVVFDAPTTDDQRPTTNDAEMAFVIGRWSFVVHLTYAELDRRANQLARHLRRLDVGPDVQVGIFMNRSPKLVIAMLGILKAGGAYVPLDPAYPAERLGFMVEDSQAQVLLTTSAERENGRAGEPENSQLPFSPSPVLPFSRNVVDLHADWPAIAHEPATSPDSGVGPANLAYVIYTSGSTGTPKGAMNTHRGIVNRLLWMQQTYRLDHDDCVLHKTSFSFDVSVWELFWPLLAGARLILARRGAQQDSAYLARLIAGSRITTLHFVPSMLEVFLDEPELRGCGTLRRVICSGEALPVALQQRYFARLSAPLHNLYGPTEAAIDVTAWACAPNDALRSVPIGRPVANTQIYLLDRALQPVPIGTPGELHIGGEQLARGYLNRPDLTAARFIPNHFDDCRLQIADCRLEQSTTCNLQSAIGTRLYKTGDLARYRGDGTIEFLGRIDAQVKLRGYRIELGEVETILAQHPSVREVAVVAREAAPPASGYLDTRLVAYIVTSDELYVTDSPDASLAQELYRWAQTRLPDYMIPSTLVKLDALPLTPSGKLDRRALPAPDWSQFTRAADYVAPRTPTEEVVADLVTQLLRAERVSVNDNLFTLGMHSLLGTRLVIRLCDIFEVKLPLRALFEAPTIAGLAEQIEMLQWVAQDEEELIGSDAGYEKGLL